jgi:hypothetical protein
MLLFSDILSLKTTGTSHTDGSVTSCRENGTLGEAGERRSVSVAPSANGQEAEAGEGAPGEEEEDEEEPSWELPEDLLEFRGDEEDKKALVTFRQAQQAARQVKCTSPTNPPQLQTFATSRT